MKKQLVYTIFFLSVMLVSTILVLSSNEQLVSIEQTKESLFNNRIESLSSDPDPLGGQAGDDEGSASIDEGKASLPPPP